jgi:flagellar hook-length control protein FliK
MDLPSSATPRTKSTADTLSIRPDAVRVSTNAAVGEFARHLADSSRMSEAARRDDRPADRRERPAATDRDRRDDEVRERDTTSQKEEPKEMQASEDGEKPLDSTGIAELPITTESDTPALETSDNDKLALTSESDADAELETTEPAVDPAIEMPSVDAEAVQADTSAETVETDAAETEVSTIPAEILTNSDKPVALMPAALPAESAQKIPAAATAGNNETSQAVLGIKAPADAPQPQTAAPQQTAVDAAPAGSNLETETAAIPANATAAKPAKGLGQEAAEAFADKKSDAKQAASSANAAPQSATPSQAPRSVGTSQQAASLDIARAETQPVSRGSDLPSGVQQTTATATVRIGTLPGQSQPTQIPAMAIAMQIARNLQKGTNRFDIRLDPPEMGRIDVRMEVRRDGHVMAHLTVEKAETLELLQRDARALQQALSNAGLNADEDSLNFSLRDQNADETHRDTAGNNRNDGDTDDVETTTAPVYNVNLSATGGIDIRV